MVYVLTIFLQNIKIQYHVVLQVCKYFFSQDYVLPIHQLTFRKTQAITGSLSGSWLNLQHWDISRAGLEYLSKQAENQLRGESETRTYQRYVNGLKPTRSGLSYPHKKNYILQYSIGVKARISVEWDQIASLKDSHKHKLSQNSEENPNLGHNHRYV